MSTYTTQNFEDGNSAGLKDKLYLSERYIYGSSRLGLEQVDKLMAFKQSDLTELDLGNPVVINSFTGPAGTWFKSDNTHGNFTNYVVFTPGDYNTDGKSDLKISHDNSSTTFGAHVWSQLDAGKSATLEWDMLTSTSKIIVLYALNDAGTILTETWCNNAGHYSTTINVPTNSTGRTRFKFYTINQSTALDYTVANFKVTGATNPWGKELAPALPVEQEELIVGDKRYELSNHLGNVLAVITDRKIPLNTTTYTADVVQYTDYSPFGCEMDQRHGVEGDRHRYSFQGQETDKEIKGDGNSVNYKYRMHDPRIGRFFAIDPLAWQYSYNSPYAFSENQVINAVELEGLEKDEVNEPKMNERHVFRNMDFFKSSAEKNSMLLNKISDTELQQLFDEAVSLAKAAGQKDGDFDLKNGETWYVNRTTGKFYPVAGEERIINLSKKEVALWQTLVNQVKKKGVSRLDAIGNMAKSYKKLNMDLSEDMEKAIIKYADMKDLEEDAVLNKLKDELPEVLRSSVPLNLLSKSQELDKEDGKYVEWGDKIYFMYKISKNLYDFIDSTEIDKVFEDSKKEGVEFGGGSYGGGGSGGSW